MKNRRTAMVFLAAWVAAAAAPCWLTPELVAQEGRTPPPTLSDLSNAFEQLAVEVSPAVVQVMAQPRWSTGVVVAAQAAGNGRLGGNFEPGDIIYSINSQRINNLNELRAALTELVDGAPLVLHIERRRELRYLELTADW